MMASGSQVMAQARPVRRGQHSLDGEESGSSSTATIRRIAAFEQQASAGDRQCSQRVKDGMSGRC